MEENNEPTQGLIEKDYETFATFCKEINESAVESNNKLTQIKEKLEKLNQEHPVKANSGNNFQYLDVKSMLLLNYCMSLQYYMLAKAEGKDLEGNEIFERLAYLRLMLEKLKPLDKKMEYQINKLLRAAVTQNQGTAALPNRQKKEDNLRYKPNLGNLVGEEFKIPTAGATQPMSEDQEESESEEDKEVEELEADDIDSEELENYTKQRQKEIDAKQRKQKDEEDEDPENQIYKAVKFNPIAMVDKKKKQQKQKEKDSKRMNRVDLVRELKNDLLELPEEVNYGIASGNKRILEEEQADEELEMKYFKRLSYSKKELKEKEKRRQKLNQSDYTGITDGFHDFRKIQDFMSKNYSDDEDDEMRKQLDKQKFIAEHRNKRDKKSKQKFLDEEINSDEAGNDVLFKDLTKIKRGPRDGAGKASGGHNKRQGKKRFHKRR